MSHRKITTRGIIAAFTLLFPAWIGCSGAGTEPAGSQSEGLVASTGPVACVSQEDGPCGGFTQNPCTCASGLVCVPNPIPDIPGTCEPDRCCPVGWDMTTCSEENGTKGLN